MRSGNWNSAYKGLQSRLTMGLFRLLYIAGSQRPVKIDELRHATTIWTPGDLPHRHWPSYRTKTICFVLVMFIYLSLFNLRWTGFTSPQPIVGRVYPSTLAFYPSKGRVDGSLDEAVVRHYVTESPTVWLSEPRCDWLSHGMNEWDIMLLGDPQCDWVNQGVTDWVMVWMSETLCYWVIHSVTEWNAE